MITVLDIETTFKKDNEGKLDVDPYTGNMLVSVGYDIVDTESGYICFTHTEKEPTENGFAILQKVLDDTDIFYMFLTQVSLTRIILYVLNFLFLPQIVTQESCSVSILRHFGDISEVLLGIYWGYLDLHLIPTEARIISWGV